MPCSGACRSDMRPKDSSPSHPRLIGRGHHRNRGAIAMHLRVHPVRATSVLAVGSVLAGCGGAAATATAVHPAAAVPATPGAHATAVVHTASRPSRIDAVTAAAKRLYSAEVHGTHALDTRDGVGSDPKLLALLGSGNMTAVRAYVTSEYRRVWYHWHVSYLSI